MLPLGRYKVTDGERDWTWEPDEATVGEALMIEGEYGAPYRQWITALNRVDIKAAQVLCWFLRRKEGEQVELAQVTFKVQSFDFDKIEDVQPDPEAQAVSETATEQPSQTGSASDPGSSSGSPSLTSVA